MHKGTDDVGGERKKRTDNFEEEAERLLKIINGVYFGEFVEIIKDTRKLFILNFLLGMTRGMGMALGFTFLGAIVFYILKQIIVLNLPVISRFIAEIVRLVELQSQLP
ncbi:MAG: hypothetical protein GX088_03290 [Clostridia bacterium]|nr:hypothetical protein [Clostridia bacterium]